MPAYTVQDWPDVDERYAMTKAEAREHFDFFMSVKDKRIEMLRELVHADTGLELSYTKRSLRELHPWCQTQARIRWHSDEQTALDRQDPMLRVSIDTEGRLFELTKRAGSIGADLGIFCCETLIRKEPALRWDLDTRRSININNPSVHGFRTNYHPEDPIRRGCSYLYRLAEVRLGRETPPIMRLDQALALLQSWAPARTDEA
ncbi:MAG: hypothetical protein RIE77_01645 [Phycisphaerales bacterium]|jgi:hypothetical protein